MRRRISCFCVAVLALTAFPATRVQFWFDTEDYTYDGSSDAIRDIANLLTEEGVRGQFNIVGYLARSLLENRREDVIRALKPHLVGTQTLYHSRHPNITELTDLKDYDEAYRMCLAEEAEGLGYLKAAFGLDRLLFSCYPGNGSSPVALDVHSDLGAVFHGGLGAMDHLKRGDAVWYQNMRQIIYNIPLCLEDLFPGCLAPEELHRRLGKYADYEAIVLYMHPDMVIKAEHWDVENFKNGNLTPFGRWVKPALRPPDFAPRFYANLRAFIRLLKADSRFEITDCEKLLAVQRSRKAIGLSDIPAIRAALLRDLGPVDSPASWCVADCFQAAVRLLRGESPCVPGRVYGFLEYPRGVIEPTVVRASDLRACAERISFKRHLPVSYDVGGARIGPADFLLAALEILETGAEQVTVSPRDQLGSISKHLPWLSKFRHDGWIYWPEFKDRYLSDRLRWQYWTLRYE